jgi:hypothetical protein
MSSTHPCSKTRPDQLFFLVSKVACSPALTRTYRIDVKPTKKTAAALDNEKAQIPQPTTQNSKYRIETPPAAVVAFAHRLGLNQLKDQTLLMRIVTHPSYEKVGIATNERLDYLGKNPSLSPFSPRQSWIRSG